MSVNSRHIAPSEWECHRAAIVGLRRSGIILQGEDGIMATMKSVHGFLASASQYELQLNKWEERKNLHADEWRQIIQQVDQYNKDGIKCDVYKNGQLIPRCTLKRKRKEYCKEQGQVKRRSVGEAASSLPECIEIRTSPSLNQVGEVMDLNVNEDFSNGISTITSSIIEPSTESPALHVPEVGHRGLVDLVSDNLVPASCPRPQEHTVISDASFAETHHARSLDSPFPWIIDGASEEALLFELESLSRMEQQFPFADIEPVAEVDNELSVSKLSVVADHSTPIKDSELGFRPASRNTILVEQDTSLGQFFNFDLIDAWSPRIPFLRFEENLQSQANFYLNAKSAACIQQPSDNDPRDLMSFHYAKESRKKLGNSLSTQAQSILAQSDPSPSSDGLTKAEMFNSALLSLFPPDAMSPPFSSTIQHTAFPSSFHRSLIFSVGNNFAGLEGVPVADILEFLAKDTQMHYQLIKYLRASPNYVCKALAENLVRAAIETCDATLVTALISTGFVTPDEIVCPHDGYRYTALERSAMLRNTEVTRALLVAGADVNKTRHSQGALGLAIRVTDIYGPVDIQQVNLLLECGAKVRPYHLFSAVCNNDTDLVRSLLSKFSPSQHHDYLRARDDRQPFIEQAVKFLDCELATMIVTQMLQACFQADCGKCAKSSMELRKSIAIAAMRGFSKLVILLLEYTPKEEFPLAAAVRSGQKDLVEFLLKQGANVDAPASTMPGDGRMVYTPLGEAIRVGNNELIRNFESRGALIRIREMRRFRSAIYAAAEVKNVPYAQKLLQLAHDIPGEALDLALEISIREGHEELALLLLRAGADVNADMDETGNDSYTYKPDIASLIALRQKNEMLVRAIMDCNMRLDMSREDQPYDSPLLLAARWGNLCIVRDLLTMGADVDGVGKSDDVRSEQVNFNNDDDDDDGGGIRYLHRYEKYYLQETAITAAVKGRNKLLVQLLVNEHQASLNLFSDQETSPLAAAISNRDIEMFRYLLELGADPACHSAFRKAILKDREMLPDLLRAFRTRYPSGKPGFGGVPLRTAITRNDEQVLDALLEAKLDVNSFAVAKWKRFNSLGTAIRKHGRHNLKIIRKLLLAGSDPNGIVTTTNECLKKVFWSPSTASEDISRLTALLEAISTKNRTLVELLVEAGANINRPARLGIKRTPLQRACEVGSFEIVEFLLGRGADANDEPALRGGGTSLQLCAIAGYAGIADKLLKHGANVHAPRPEMNGRTALEGAAEHGRLDMLKILWNATAGKGFDSEQMDCAMKLAEGNGHFACRDFIQELRLVDRAFIMLESLNF